MDAVKAVATKLPLGRMAWMGGLLVVGFSMVELEALEPFQGALRYVGDGLLAYSGFKAFTK